MGPTLIVLMLMGGAIATLLLTPWLTHWRRQRLRRRPLPQHWHSLLAQIPVELSVEARSRWQGNIQVFLASRQFIGCDGLQVTEDMRLLIAATASLLLLGEASDFPKLRTILLYPAPYRTQELHPVGPYIEARQVIRLGESWSRDQLVLVWQQVAYDLEHWQDGHNVVLHEFAHQLDQADGQTDGVPILPDRAAYRRWAQIMSAAYARLCAEVSNGARSGLDSYGATNPAEFFAVATETFFERPRHLQRWQPDLYAQLRDYYRLDPLAWQD
jgi:hypothetical protein